MNRQSKGVRWSSVVENANQFSTQFEQTMRQMHVPANIHREAVHIMADPILMAAEADPLVVGTKLEEVISPVVAAAQSLRSGDFKTGVSGLAAASTAALAVLPSVAADYPSSEVDEVIDELERAFLLSLLTTLTAQSYVLQTVREWESRSLEATKKGKPLPKRYLDVSRLEFEDAQAAGRIHIQHLISAIDSGMTSMVAGSSFRESERYPELQIVLYGQWFTYFHAIWDEQIRKKLAAAHGCKASDILIPFFGDVRLVRNDFVHKKGIADKSAETEVLEDWFTRGRPMEISPERMLSLISLFPRDQLRNKPQPQERKRQAVGGSIPVELDALLRARMQDRKLTNREAVVEEALQAWCNRPDEQEETKS
ncbi:hypothetical protein [Rhodococcus jostii]|uniref:Uncharacterized protein n=1 Tax=Rhodococcus jostii TaxID=132919 RepID=A0ABU4CN36_RHOJO|nr:hypothetical protein [Rhodococcus jostii]MDV6284996.1 hypothetical protein [Rhodococcus jostii]